MFVCDAHVAAGMGHGSRCARLAEIVSRQTPGTKMAFQGSFSDGAIALMTEIAGDIPFLSSDETVTADTVFVDRMASTQDPEAYPADIVEKLQSNGARIVYMASGVTVPPLPEKAVCVGYQPSSIVSAPPYLYWGIEYAPTFEIGNQHTTEVLREADRAFIALGGAPDNCALRLVLEAVSMIADIKNVDLLGSPVNSPIVETPPVGAHQTLHCHDTGREIPFLLGRAGLVLASFGNLGYEALAAGAAVCLVGQKQFQADLAGLLQNQGLVVSVGLIEERSLNEVIDSIQSTIMRSNELSAMARRLVDGQGLNRIARIILSTEDDAHVVC